MPPPAAGAVRATSSPGVDGAADRPRYTANLMKIGAMLPETIALLSAWDGESKEQFTRAAVEGNLVGKATRTRVADLLRRVFWRRFPPGGRPGVAEASAFVRAHGFSAASRLMCLHHAAVADPFLQDLLSVLAGDGGTGPGARLRDAVGASGPGTRLRQRAVAGLLSTADAVEFLRERGGPAVGAWSPNTAARTAAGALAALRDFGVLEGRARKRLVVSLPVPLDAFVYVAAALRARGASAREIASSGIWRAFLLGPADVELLLLRAHSAGHFRYYHLGDVWRIDWPEARTAGAEWGVGPDGGA